MDIRQARGLLTQSTLVILCLLFSTISSAATKQRIHALYIPLADHYAALVAYERYRDKMIHADFIIEKMGNWDLLRGYFQTGEPDMAFVMSPLAMDMYRQQQNFRWIGLMHRDGNALAINDLFRQQIQLPPLRKDRLPTADVAKVLQQHYQNTAQAVQIGMPHVLSTHSVVLYRYLKQHGVSMSTSTNRPAEVLAITVAPPKSPAFIKARNNRAELSAFEQSLPWADVVETQNFGHVAWYSKDVMPWPNGHVECIALASDQAIANKFAATKEVMHYIRQAGDDIEQARLKGGSALDEIVRIVRKHIPEHNREAIIASLNPELKVINYQHLNIDKAGLKQIMDLAVEGKIITEAIDIDAFADTRFDGE
ncbi:nitrate ABC transporter substrate-binding protein [Cycloclasticus sp. 46_120_T64]|nr:nitrate ABC transporter substrate-binding protein [Cycloclasticus sp. 46_120_T64]